MSHLRAEVGHALHTLREIPMVMIELWRWLWGGNGDNPPKS
jgi:hypothetical protein